MVTFYALVRDALLAMAGASPAPILPLRAAERRGDPQTRRGAPSTSAGIVERGSDGRWQVRTTGAQGSGILRSMSEANGLVVLGHAQGDVAAGEEVDVLPFDGLM